MEVLILGYGNPSRQDDGVGHYIVNALNRHWGLPAVGLLGEPVGQETAQVGPHRVTTLWLQQLDMGLAEEVAGVDRALFVDAHVDEEALVIKAVGGGTHFGVTSHVLTPDTVVELAESCFGHRPQAWRVSLRGERWNFGAGLSPELAARADALVEQLLAEVFSDGGLTCTS